MAGIAVSQSTALSSSWRAKMAMDFVAGPQRTFVKRKHLGPLGMQRAFYPELDVCHVYLLHPPGGVVGGDLLQIEANNIKSAVRSTTKQPAAFVTTPGATKFYRSAGQTAVFNQKLNVNAGSLEWFPQENIFFDGSKVQLNTEINIASDASFMGWDIQVFGRRAGERPYTTGEVDSQLRISIADKRVLSDRLRIIGNRSIQRVTGLRGYCVYGSQLFYPFDPVAIASARKVATYEQGFSLTAFDACLLVRYLGNEIEIARTGFTALWQHLRKAINARDSMLPRIWST